MHAPGSPLKIYLSHAQEDEAFCERLERHLSVLHREGQIACFRRGAVAPGEDIEAAMKAAIECADMILLLVVPDQQPPGAAYHPAWYVPRPREEREALNALSFAGKPGVLWGPSRFGKTWLFNHCLEHIRRQNSFDTILVDLRLLNRKAFDVLLQDLASRICEERLEQPEKALSEAWSRPGTASTRITRLLETRVLPAHERGLVLAIDGVDEVWQSPFQDDLCALL